MAQTVLIHGYAIDLTVPSVRDPRGQDAGFQAFAEEIVDGSAAAFRWSLAREVPLPQAADARHYRSLYEDERARTQDPEIHRALAEFLRAEQPERIVCHSMGCVLLWEYLRRSGALPPSVRHVVFVQADLPRSPEALPEETVRAFTGGTARLHNLSCCWDPTLLLSSVLHREVRAGIAGLRVPYAHNEVFPLWRPWNLHTSSIRDPQLRNWVAAL